MKLLKVKIGRNQSTNKTSYTYPPEYNPTKFKVLIYESQLINGYNTVVNRDDGLGEKNNHEYVIGLVEDLDSEDFLKSKDIIELDRTEVETFLGDDLNKKTEKIVDQNKVLSILAKAARQETLTDEDLKVIDPADPTVGINYTKSLNEVLQEYGI